jgi:hypothetical protein
MKKTGGYCLLLTCLVIIGCNDLDDVPVEKILTEENVYPKYVEVVLFRNTEADVKRLIEKGLVKEGLVTTQAKHTIDDIGKPLIYFTEKATPYLLPTSDTLRSFDDQRVRVGVEHLLRVVKIDVNPGGNKALVDYFTIVKEQTPFSVLYPGDLNVEHERRTSFSRTDKGWQWDGRIIKMPGKQK